MDIDFYTEIDKQLAKIPYCSSKCVYYMICPVCDRSNTQAAKCALLLLDDSMRRRFINLYLRGRDGLKAESTELLFNLAWKLDLKNKPADMITYIDTILKIDRSFKVTVDSKAGPEMKASKSEEIPESIDVVVTQKAKKPDPNEKIVRSVEKELDKNPESLYNSHLVDEMKARMKIGQFKLPNEKEVIEINMGKS
jgi:hypothetical protein